MFSALDYLGGALVAAGMIYGLLHHEVSAIMIACGFAIIWSEQNRWRF